MQNNFTGFVAELNKNKLRVMSSELEIKSIDLDESIVKDTKIISLPDFEQKLKGLLKEFKLKSQRIVFLIEEKDIFDRFFVVRNDEADTASYLKNQASTYVGEPLDNLYTVFQKVSPFVYQFIGVQKDFIDTYIAISEKLNLKLEAVLPTSFVFARFVGSIDPFFFIFKGVDESTLVASEYGGVYFSGTFATGGEISSKMSSLIQNLSTFNREKPVKDIFFIGDDLKVESNFTTKEINIPIEVNLADYKGFERLLLVLSLVNQNYTEFVNSYFNLKGFIKFSEPAKSTSITKYIAPALAVLSILVLVLFFMKTQGNQTSSVQTPEVIGEKESSPSIAVDTTASETTKSATLLDKSLLKLRVENGAGVAGTAGKAKDSLTPLGYVVTEVGNADKFDYESTVVKIKLSKKDYLEVLKTDLSSKYTIQTFTDLAEDKSYDVLIIVGKK